jgi:glycosyltransferase involved in cell wall biosynthesis
MRLLFVADGRSPIARNWMAYFIEAGHEVHLLSTFPCLPGSGLASFHVVPVAFSGLIKARDEQHVGIKRVRSGESWRTSLFGGARLIRFRSAVRHWFGPWTIARAVRTAQQVFQSVQPDLVHAMRIPFEGMLASAVDSTLPLLVSVWGNDFTLHAPATPMMTTHTRRTLERVDGLHTDCRRDLRLARQLGFQTGRLELVLPAGGGIKGEVFHPGEPDMGALIEPMATLMRSIPVVSPVVVNPRGFRAYVRNDTFFQSIPQILKAHPRARFLCPAMAGEAQALRWIERLGVADSVHLLPKLSQAEMAAVYQRADVTVSVTEHDGTPNTLLEALACGCFPVVGDIESLREWIDQNENGLLVDPGDPHALAGAVIRALSDDGLRETSRAKNLAIIAERAEYSAVMAKATDFYQELAV